MKRMGKRMTSKSEIECFYCGKLGHTTINCKIYANNLFKGKLKEVTNIAIAEIHRIFMVVMVSMKEYNPLLFKKPTL
jgi:hypothetical protein